VLRQQLARRQAALRRRRFQNRTVAGPQILRIPMILSMVILIGFGGLISLGVGGGAR
jgi:hypothetical protein